jgi:hypothetical protein
MWICQTKSGTGWGSVAQSRELRNIGVKAKRYPVTGSGGLLGSETSRPPHCLENRLTDGDESVSLTLCPPFTFRKIPGTHFC